MHPNAFLQTFWRMELKPQIFVAMSFDPKYDERFSKVIKPAIEGINFDDVPLKAHRVDLSKTGDSILTDIIDGIAHSRLVLADVSSVGDDSVTGFSYRNANVMYEVGIALACRQPHDVLLVRDDTDKFLFDVSTVPHKKMDFTKPAALETLRDELIARLNVQTFLNDARVQRALLSLSNEEVQVLREFNSHGHDTAMSPKGQVVAYPRLLDKQVVYMYGSFEKGDLGYALTPLGKFVAHRVATGLRALTAILPKKPPEEPLSEVLTT